MAKSMYWPPWQRSCTDPHDKDHVVTPMTWSDVMTWWLLWTTPAVEESIPWRWTDHVMNDSGRGYIWTRCPRPESLRGVRHHRMLIWSCHVSRNIVYCWSRRFIHLGFILVHSIWRVKVAFYLRCIKGWREKWRHCLGVASGWNVSTSWGLPQVWGCHKLGVATGWGSRTLGVVAV